MTGSLKTDPTNIGLDWIVPADGFDALENLLLEGSPFAAVIAVSSWRKFTTTRPPGTSSLFASLISSETTPHTIQKASSEEKEKRPRTFIDVLTVADPQDREHLIAEHLRLQLSQILSLSTQFNIDEDMPLHDLGLDSLMAVELRNALQVSLARPLSATLVLDYPTLQALRGVLLREIFKGEAYPNNVVVSAYSKDSLNIPMSNIEELSDVEAEAQLLEELERTNVAKY
jgi:acyl carrier protein